MESLLEKAYKFLSEHPEINEVELSDGTNRVRVVRNAPVNQYPYWTYTYTPPNEPKYYPAY